MESPFTVFIRSIIDASGEELYTTNDVAEAVGRSRDTIERWRRRDVCGAPSKEVVYRGRKVYLYTADDLAALKQYAEETYPGKRNDLPTRRRYNGRGSNDSTQGNIDGRIRNAG